MKLDDVKWFVAGAGVRYAEIYGGMVWEITELNSNICYTIQSSKIAPTEAWFGVDPFTAQAILFHLEQQSSTLQGQDQ